jgi:hypothetical protein
MKAKAIPLSTKRSNSSPAERAVRGGKGVLAKRLEA